MKLLRFSNAGRTRRITRTPWINTAACGVAALWLSAFGGPGFGQTTSPVAAASNALRSRDYAGALKISGEGLKQAPGDVRLLTLEGMAYAGESKPEAALESFRRALTGMPDFLPALEGAAQVAYQQGGEGAKPFLVHILTLRSSDPTANAMLAVLEYRSGDCSDAVGHFEQARALLPGQPDALLQYGACLATLNRLDESIPILQQALDAAPANQVARYNLALAQSNANQPDAALQTLAPMLADPAVPEDVLTLAADVYESKQDTQHAVEVLRQAIVAHPKEKAAYLQFAYLSSKHNSLQVGLDMVNLGITQLPNTAELYLARGVLLSQTENSQQAIDDFERASRLDPNLSFTGAAEGIARSQAHDPTAALVSFRAAAKKNPNDALTLYLLAEAVFEGGPAPDTPAFAEARAALQRSIAIDGKRLEAHDLLASLYLRSGDTELSLEQSETALRIDPTDEEALYHKILALRRGERKAEIPTLVQQLMKVRETKAAAAKQVKVYRLVESPAAPPA